MTEYRGPWRVSQLATHMGVHAETIYAMVRSGELRAFRIGRQLRIPHEEVERIENTPAVGPRAS